MSKKCGVSLILTGCVIALAGAFLAVYWLLSEPTGIPQRFWAVCFSPDGKNLVGGLVDALMKV